MNTTEALIYVSIVMVVAILFVGYCIINNDDFYDDEEKLN